MSKKQTFIDYTKNILDTFIQEDYKIITSTYKTPEKDVEDLAAMLKTTDNKFVQVNITSYNRYTYILYIYYKKNNKIHNDNGTAAITIMNDEIQEKRYYLHGEEVKDEFKISIIESC